jgi:hypothetical protein
VEPAAVNRRDVGSSPNRGPCSDFKKPADAPVNTNGRESPLPATCVNPLSTKRYAVRPDVNERSRLVLRERRKQRVAFASSKHGVELSRSLFFRCHLVNALADYGRRAYGACFGRDPTRLATQISSRALLVRSSLHLTTSGFATCGSGPRRKTENLLSTLFAQGPQRGDVG